MKRRTANAIYIASGVSVVLLLGSIFILLIMNVDRNLLPFNFAAETGTQYRFNYLIHSNSVENKELDDMYFYIFDMGNLTFGNQIENRICWPECTYWQEDLHPTRILIKAASANIKIYRIDGARIEENPINDQRYFKLTYFDKDKQTFEDLAFESLESLEEHLKNNLVYSSVAPENFEIVSSGENNTAYEVRLVTGYVEILQDTILPDCDFLHIFNERYDAKSKSFYFRETCKKTASKEITKFDLFFGQSEKTIVSAKNASFILPNYGILENDDRGEYLLVFDDVADFTIEYPDHEVSFYTEGFDSVGMLPNGTTNISKADITIKSLPGNIVMGKNEYKIPPDSELAISAVSNLTTGFTLYAPDNSFDINPVQARGENGTVLLNRDSLVEDESKNLVDLKYLAIPVLTALLTSILAFSFGLFLGRKEQRRISKPKLPRKVTRTYR